MKELKMSKQVLLVVFTMLVLVWFMTSLMGCGYVQSARPMCKLPSNLCDVILGFDQFEVNYNTDKRIDGLEKEIESLKTTLDLLISEVQSYGREINTQKALIQLLSADVTTNAAYITSINEDIEQMQEHINNQQVVINNHQVELANLAMQDGITELFDPCGDAVGFDEVLLKTKSGSYIAYFESGSQRYLTVLKKNTNYRVTDGSNCYFTINNNGEVANEHY